MPTYGRYVTAGDTDLGHLGAGQQRASVYEKMPVNAWGYRLGYWGGRLDGHGVATVRVAVWTTKNLQPDRLMGQTNGMSITTRQVNGSTGQQWVANVASTNRTYSPANNAIKLHAGYNYAIGLVGTGAMSGHSMIQASKMGSGISNKYFYNRDGVSSPTDPFNSAYSSHEGWVSAWIEYVANRAPTAATSTPSGLQTTTKPTFQGTFSDPDTAYGDHMTLFRIQVVRASDGAVMWDTGNLAPTSSERANNRFSRAYGGTALAAGVEYRWRCRVADSFGTWSSWSSYRSFTINGGGYLDTLSGVSGKQNTLQPTPFTAVWRHANNLSMNAFRVRLLQNGTVIRTSSIIAASRAVGATLSASWSGAFGSYSLSWGMQGLSWQMQGRDTSNLWSDWTPARSFSTNTAPTVPTNLTPANSQATSARPLLRAKATDADGDNVTVYARIKNEAGTVIATRTMTKSGDWFEYQTTSSDLATHAIYRWDAYSYDGHLYSGEATTAAAATKSSEAVFVYAEVPNVVLTSPTPNHVYTTSSVPIRWESIPNQRRYRIHAYAEDGSEHRVSSWVTSSTISGLTLTATTWGWRNETNYQIAVEIEDMNGLVGMSARVPFSFSYIPPDAPENFYASPEYMRLDTTPSAIRLTWEPTYDDSFMEYMITRRRTGEDPSEAMIVARITSPQNTVFIDDVPESNVSYIYSLTVATFYGLDITVSEPVEAQAEVQLEHVILQDVLNPDNRAILRLDSERSFDHVDDMVLIRPWGASAPIGVYGTTQYERFSGRFTLATDEVSTAEDHVNALRSLWRSRATVVYRDERGRKFYGKITKFSEQDRRIQNYTVDVELTEVHHVEGVV